MQGSAASRALSIPSLVSLILSYRCLLEPATPAYPHLSTSAKPPQLPPYYSALCATSLISLTFKHESQVLLNQTLHFYKGTRQLTKWLEGGNGGKWKNEKVVVLDVWPFKEGKEGKWDFDVVKKVIEGSTEVRSMVLSFTGRVEMPNELLCCDTLQGERIEAGVEDQSMVNLVRPFCFTDLDNLLLASPLSTSSTSDLKPAFKKLSILAVIDQYSSKIARSWTSTFSFLSLNKVMIYALDLSYFPLYSKYLMPHVYPLAWSLYELRLPRLELGGLFAFAQGCINLERLSITTIDVASIPALCQLLVFPPTLKAIHVTNLEGSLTGYFDNTKEGKERDTMTQLIDTVEKMLSTMDALKLLQIEKIKWWMGEHERRLDKLMKEKGLEVEIGYADNTRTDGEVRFFFVLSAVDASKANEVMNRQMKEFAKTLQDSLQTSIKLSQARTSIHNDEQVDASDEAAEKVESNGVHGQMGMNGNEEKKSELNGNGHENGKVDAPNDQ